MTTSKYYDDDREYQYKKPEKYIRKVGDLVLYKGKTWFVDDTNMVANRDGIYYINDCLCSYTLKRVHKKNGQVYEMHLSNEEIETLPLLASNDVKYLEFEQE